MQMKKKFGSAFLLATLALGSGPLSWPAQAAVAVSAQPDAAESLLALLPDSDVVALINAPRAFNELLPKLKTISTGGIGKTATEIEMFARLAGVDVKQIQLAALGVKMTETLGRGSGVLLLQGLSVDPQRVAEAAKAVNGSLQSTEANGKQLYSLSFKTNGDAETVHFAVLENQRLALGDLSGVKAVLAGGSKNPNQLAFSKVLKETKAAGLVRFAGNLPEGLRTMLASQGELFAQVAAVKAIFGSFDLNADSSATLDGRLRTASATEATQLKESLAGLIALGKAFLGGDDSPKMKLYSTLLDTVKIGVAASDVSLLLQLPKEMIEKL